MKVLRVFFPIALLGSAILFSNCGGGKGNQEPLSDKQLGLLSKVTWKVGKVYKDGGDSTSTGWTNFTFKIDGTKAQPTTFTYTCTGRPKYSVWKASGSWQFGTDPATQVVRDDGAQITYSVDAASSKLHMEFDFSGSPYTRVSNVSGHWAFDLIPQ